tara:strand:+ start:256 stop:1197 length:942 start_codon:yes stop_codon:yes gene_type:complete
MSWSTNAIPSQAGRTVLITGANSGIGFETAKALLKRGASVILGCRSIHNAEKAQQELRKITNYGNIDLLEIDLSDLEKVEIAGEQILGNYQNLGILFNNAGVMAPPKTLSKQGFEIQLAVNHLSHMALTLKLLPLMSKQKGGRIVTVSSGAQYLGKINWNDLHGEKKYDRWASYSQSKLANVMFALELDLRIKRSNLDLDSLSAHPGLARTNLQPTSVKANDSWQEAIAYKLMDPFFQSSRMGALPQLLAATDSKAKGGEQYGPRFSFRGTPKPCKIASLALEPKERERLWEISQKLIDDSVEINKAKFYLSN